MSESPILEYWPEGIAAARIPANNNVRLITALLLNAAISGTTAAQPGSPAEGDVYILPASPTGSNWASFSEDDVVIYYNATWTAYTPNDGLRKFVEDEGEDWQYVGGSSGSWAAAGGGGGGAVDSVNGQTGVVVLELDDLDDVSAAAPSDQDVLTWDAGTSSWIAQAGGGGGGGGANLTVTGTSYNVDPSNDKGTVFMTNSAAKSVNIDDDATTALPAGYFVNIINRNATGDITIVPAGGVTVQVPSGGSLVIAPGDAFTLVRFAADEFNLIGKTL